MAFISSTKHNRGNDEVNTASVYTASSNVPTASANVATVSISQETACAYIASQSNGSQIKFEDINQIDEDDMEEMDIKWNMALLSMRADKGNDKVNTASIYTASSKVLTASANVATIDEDDIKEMDIKWNMALLSIRADKFWKKTGKKISIQGSDVAGFDKSKVECFNCHKMGHFARERRAPRNQDRGRRDNYRQGEDHALVTNKEAPTEFALMANIITESKVFDNSLCSKDCKKNNDSLNSKITDLTDKLFDAKNMIYHYKLALAQVESGQVEYKEREVKYIEKIRTLEYYHESKKECNKTLKNELKTLKQEKEVVDGKLAGLLTASKDLNNLIESQRSDKSKEGLGYTVVPLPPAQLYLSPKKDLSWTSLPECADDTVINYSRPSPTIESSSKEDQNRNPFVSKNVASPITPKPFVKFVKASDSQSKSPDFVMKKKACFNCGDFNHLAYECRKKGSSQNKIDDKGYWDSSCSRNMTGNISYLSDYEPFARGYVSFGQGGCKITGKGTIKTESIVLGRDFKLLDDDNILLRTPRQHNMYSIDLNNIVPHRDLTCLVAKASADECMIWHRRLCHLNFKTKNKLVRHNLVRGLPTKCFENDHNCTVCLKGKQHKASWASLFFWQWELSSLAVGSSFGSGNFIAGSGNALCILFLIKLNNLYDLFVPQREKSSEQRYFSKRSRLSHTPVNNGNSKESFHKQTTLLQKRIDESIPGNSNPTATSTNPPADQLETLTVETLIPTFEYILGVTTNSEELKGVEADVSNMETTITASPTPTLRIYRDHPKSQIIGHVDTLIQTRNKSKEMDVKSAFLYGTIDEEVVTIDQTLFIRRQRGDFILVQVYVDDIIFGSLNLQLCREFEALMHEKFQMIAMGELNFFLGLQVLQKENGSFLSQDKYGKDGTGKDVDLHLYRSRIGSLMYLTASRPDIMFAVCACARHQVTPKECHLHSVKRIFQYLKGHPKLGLWYPKDSPFDLVAHSDSDYGGATQDHKSTTGGCSFLGRRLISWQCKKQKIIATSTTEAEYVAAASCLLAKFQAQEVEISRLKETVKIMEDKGGVIGDRSGDDAPIKLDEGEVAAERASEDTKEMAIILTTIDAAIVLVSGTTEVPTGSGSIPTDGPSADEVPTGSDVVPTASLVFATATVIDAQITRELKEQLEREDQRRSEQIAADEEITRIHAEEELQIMIDGLDRSNEVISKHLAEYEQAATDLTIGERIELINELVKYQDHHFKILQYQAQQKKPRTKKQKRDFYMTVIGNNLGWKAKDFKDMSFEEVEAKFKTVWEQIEGGVSKISEGEAAWLKRKGIRSEQESAKKQKISEAVPEEVKSSVEVPEEKIKEMMQLVPIEEVYVEALQVKHPIINWKVHTEGQRAYWKITRLGGSSTSYQFFTDLLKHLDRNDLNQLWSLVKETFSKRLATSDKEMEL
nr:hypothetical protein [Tanacetum cinerariifolium]